MNNKQLKILLADYIEEAVFKNESDYHDCDIILDQASVNDIIFYSLKNSKKSQSDFIQREEGATYGCLILNRVPPNEPKGNYIVVKDNVFMKAQKRICDEFFPIDKDKIISGVTGTNGKTTTVSLACQIAHQNGLRAFTIGSIGIRDHREKLEDLGGMTSPPFIHLRKYLYKYFKDYDVLFMEVSSHAIHQHRVEGLKFYNGAWTSFTQDHLDYHDSLEDYLEVKKRFPLEFIRPNGNFFIPVGNEDLKKKLEGIPYTETQSLKSQKIIELPEFFRPKFNQDDLELAIELVEDILKKKPHLDINSLQAPEGRFEVYKINELMAIIDSAHTPGAFENILKAIAEAYPTKQKIVLFGCGGDRDPSKRQEMGRIAYKYADKLFVTSDNPRTEDPKKIIRDINPPEDSVVIVDREQAVSQAVASMTENDLLVMLGKGPENYQIIGTQKKQYSDFSCFLKNASKRV